MNNIPTPIPGSPDPLLGSLGDSTQSQRDVIFVETTWGQKEPPTRCLATDHPSARQTGGWKFKNKMKPPQKWFRFVLHLFRINSRDLSSFNPRFSPCVAPRPGINLHLSMYLIPNTGPLGHPYQLVAACQLSKVYVKASWSLTTTLIVKKCWHETHPDLLEAIWSNWMISLISGPPGETIIDWLAWLAALENNPSTNFQLGPLSLLQLKLLTLAAPHVVQNHDLKSPWRSPSGTLGTSS